MSRRCGIDRKYVGDVPLQSMFLLLVFFVSAVSCDEFWTTTEVVAVDWRDDCLTTATCAKPRFQIFVNLVTVNEHQQSSWPVYEQLEGRRLASHWTNGFPEDVVVSSQVVGIDSEFSFPRVCDQTTAMKAFVTKPIEFDVIETSTPEPEVVERTVKLVARCFNATLILRKYVSRCPWCHEEARQEKSVMSGGSDRYFLLSLVALAIVTVSASVACVFSLLICRNSSSRRDSFTSTPMATPVKKTTVIIPQNRFPSPPTFTSPSPPSLTSSQAYGSATVIIHDDNYDHISPNSTIYSPRSERAYDISCA